jgi:tRNA-Thr(GGU) m(6)t(6)A37 methyltransferase TsaA
LEGKVMSQASANVNQQTFSLFPIGYVRRDGERTYLEILEPYRPALKELEHFGFVHVFWWCNYTADDECRRILQNDPPYDVETPTTGVFASRSPVRPNPISLTTARVLEVDLIAGTVDIVAIDAFDDTPVIDLKAYFPVCDRVKDVKVPEWVAHWPEWMPDEGIGLSPEELAAMESGEWPPA